MKKINTLIQFLKMALRNIWRSRKRSIITMLSICVGTITLLFLMGYILMMDNGLKGNTIEKETGHFQVIKKNYLLDDSTSFQYSINEKESEKMENYISSLPGVSSITQRIQISGMIGTQNKSSIFMGVCDTTDTLVSMIPNIVEGSSLSVTDPEGIIIGKKLSDKLGVTVNDTVLLFVSTSSGSPEAIQATIRGIYKGIIAEQESMIVYIPIETAWSLMLEKPRHRIIVFLDDIKDLPPIMKKTQSFISQNDYSLEVKPWDEIALMYKQVIGMFGSFVAIGSSIIFLVIIFGISNTMYMAIHDRTHEIGTMRALGKTKNFIIGLFFTEGLSIGFLGAFIGITITLIAMPIINTMGLTLPPGPGQTDRIPLMFAMNIEIIFIVIIVNVSSAAIASLLPAWKASKQKIADSLRFS